MNRFILTILGATLLAMPAAALDKTFYKSRSMLADDTWVKVGVTRTGVYEISYEALRAMGFEDPSKVGVYGRGGAMMPTDFTTVSGRPQIEDDISPVAVMHADNKIYFYARGVDDIIFKTAFDYETLGYFSRNSLNIYSNRGYYFLTDRSDRPKSISTRRSLSTTGLPELDWGVSMVYHEIDREHNSTDSGQLFWEHSFDTDKGGSLEWDVQLPSVFPNSNAAMECHIYATPVEKSSAGTFSYGFRNGRLMHSQPYVHSSSTSYRPVTPTLDSISVASDNGKLFLDVDVTSSFNTLAFDYWLISYRSMMPSLQLSDGSRLAQQRMALPGVPRRESALIKLNDCETWEVFDVTTPSTPVRLEIIKEKGVGTVKVENSGTVPQLVIFDRSRPQMSISGYESAFSPVANQNLHAWAETGADMLIITTPDMKEYADELADVHRQADDATVVVATTEECYNEFSGGTPDPMAYRNFAKMLFMAPRPLRHILLFGPMFGDFRGIRAEKHPFEGIIAYQGPVTSIEMGAHNVNDFYGMMDDYLRTESLEQCRIDMGVGILPVKFPSEARMLVNKIRDYINDDTHAYHLNSVTSISGLYDTHTHDLQMKTLQDTIAVHSGYSNIMTPISIDSYGNAQARAKFLSMLNSGTQLVSYCGHGGEYMLGKDRKFFSYGDISHLRNTHLPLAVFAGCQLSNFDRGIIGIGEAVVTGTPRGMIASIVSGRETWAGQNIAYLLLFANDIYHSGETPETPRHEETPCIGDVYRRSKSVSTFNNTLAYQLVGDPMIKIPLCHRDIKLTNLSDLKFVPGTEVGVKGSVLNGLGETDPTFNGEVVIRLLEPSKDIICGKIETNEKFPIDKYENEVSFDFTYPGEQMTIASARVENGEFTAIIRVPSWATVKAGEKLQLKLAAYDHSRRLGAGGNNDVVLTQASAGQTPATDTTSPVIEMLAFDDELPAINFTVADDRALCLSSDPFRRGIVLWLDGKEYHQALNDTPMVDSERPAVSKSVLLPDLSYGEHTARLQVRDDAGNQTEREIAFLYIPEIPEFSLEYDPDSDPDALRFTVAGGSPADALLIISDASGKEIYTGRFAGTEAVWPRTDSYGSRVAPGHYKAHIIERGDSTRKGHSSQIDVPVV